MSDPVLIAVASALASKAAGALVSGGAGALRSLLDFVRSSFAGRDEAEQALEAAQSQPDRPENIERLTAVLAEAVKRDPQFGERLYALWGRASTELHADRGGVINEVPGTVGGHVVQARDVTGGISFGGARAPES